MRIHRGASGRAVPEVAAKPRRTLTSRWGALAALASSAALAVPGVAAAAQSGPHGLAGNKFVQTNLVSDLSSQGAKIVDKSLKNPWGLALGPKTPLWVADNGTNVATVYGVNSGGRMVTKLPLTVSVPGGAPTGQVFNGSSGFVIKSKAGHGPALFIFDSETGRITAWSPAADPIVNKRSRAQVVHSSATAVYKGLAIATSRGHRFLYATNFHSGRVEVYNSRFKRVHLAGNFSDPSLPAGYAPFGIRAVVGLIVVTYAKQDAMRHDDVSGPGHGFVDIYTTSGRLVKRFASRGHLNSPWGLAPTPKGFGPFGGDLLVGDFGDGRINVFSPSGRFLGQLRDTKGKPIAIDGLWGLLFGTKMTGGTGTLLFSAGINDEADGLFGSINPAP